jgi:hypothetical protein
MLSPIPEVWSILLTFRNCLPRGTRVPRLRAADVGCPFAIEELSRNLRDLWAVRTLPCHRESHLSSYSRSYRMITTKAELNRYFEMIDRRVPVSVSRFIRWLRMPSSFAVRLVIATLLILGGIFSFLPILGIWMLPLGLLLIAQDVPLLQKPLVASFAWGERKCDWLRVKWRNR